MKKTPECCVDCMKWEEFGKECWVYWELKKDCTHKVDNIDEMRLP